MHYIHLVWLFKENNSVATFDDLMTEPNIIKLVEREYVSQNA